MTAHAAVKQTRWAGEKCMARHGPVIASTSAAEGARRRKLLALFAQRTTHNPQIATRSKPTMMQAMATRLNCPPTDGEGGGVGGARQLACIEERKEALESSKR